MVGLVRCTGTVHSNLITRLFLDEYYLFTPRDSVAPSRIPLNEFTRSTDLLSDILTKEQMDPVVELEGARSGLKLSFDSNRMCLYHA